MKVIVRKESKKDHPAVETIIRLAFEKIENSDHKEQQLVARLRNSGAFIPELSLVAVYDNMMVGHILLTRMLIQNGGQSGESLALAPVSVLPEYQRKGIGSALIRESHKIAKKMGFKSVLVLGHKEYYPRFGYEPTVKYNIKSPFHGPDEYYMVLFLDRNAINYTGGTAVYPKEFEGA